MSHYQRIAFAFTHIVAPLAILGACGLAFVTLGAKPKPQKKKKAKPQATLVDVVPAAKQGGLLTIETSGVVVPYREIEVSAEVSGSILRKSSKLRSGMLVEKDDLLIEVDPQRFELEIQRLSKQRDQATSDLDRLDVEEKNLGQLIALAQDTLELQQKEVERFTTLFGRNASSDEEVASAKRNELTARAALVRLENDNRAIAARRTSLQQARDLASVQLKTAELNRSLANIKSPVSGVVTQDSCEEGSHVQPGERLAIIEDTSVAEIRCHLQMDDLYWVWSQDTSKQNGELPPTPATVSYQLAGKEYIWRGTLTRHDGFGLDERTRTAAVRVVVSRPERVLVRTPESVSEATYGPRSLMRGMFVTVRIRCETDRDLLQVPAQAIRPGEKLWVVRDGRLNILDVTVVHITDGAAVINAIDGQVAEGDSVVTSPVPNAEHGLAVRENVKDETSNRASKSGLSSPPQRSAGRRGKDERSGQRERTGLSESSGQSRVGGTRARESGSASPANTSPANAGSKQTPAQQGGNR